jgi:lipopolysaccharide export system protein LptC
MMLRVLLLVVLIGTAVGVTEWLRDLQQDLRRAQETQVTNAPDYTFTTVVLSTMGIDGTPRYRIKAPRMIHFPADDSSRLISPRVWFFRDDGPPVELRARRARVSAGGKRVWLPGEVYIVRPPHAKRARLTLKTRDVTVFPDVEEARTDAPVRGVNGGRRVAGVGMVLYLAAGTLNLKSRVRSTYVP